MKRRTFLRHMTHGIAVPGAMGSMGFSMPGSQAFESLLRLASNTERVLVMIYLEGGNDGLNTVIPQDQLSNLNQVRPHVRLPDDSMISLRQSDVALHPSLSDLATLYGEGRLQIIQNVGYPEQNYSHFRSTDIWMSGSESNQLVNSGWTGRYLSQRYPGFPDDYPTSTMPDPLAVEIGYGGSLLFQGAESAMSMVISDPNFFYELVNNEESEAPDTPAGDKLRYVRLIERQSQEYGEVVRAAAQRGNNAVEYPDTFIGEQLKIVSRLISGGLKTPVYMVRLGGFDTHDAQVESSDHTKGEHATLLKELNDAIISFVKDGDLHGTSDRVLGMTFSEFGRRIVSNASLGTDHGAAAPMFFFGNHLVGGVTGSNPVVSRDATYEDNLPYEFDFRQIYASVLSQWFEADAGIVNDSLLKEFESTEIIGETRLLSAKDNLDLGIKVFPNPIKDLASIDCSFTQSSISIYVFDYSGRRVARVYQGTASKNIQWNAAQLPAGRYLIVATDGALRKTFPIVKL
jgi:uncharacterized protein (DUF1501 family)